LLLEVKNMELDFQSIDKHWQLYWAENQSNKVLEDANKPKYYVLDMFPYPSGAGLHVGHPLGYIASDIYARYMRLKGFNVLHPMGYDSFGLPAEQYAIQTGQHPALTTAKNISRYREQLDRLGFSYDWDRQVKTSSPDYYRWTQWIFKQFFNAFFNTALNKAQPISELISEFSIKGNQGSNAYSDNQLIFSAKEWNEFTPNEQEKMLLNYRLAFLSETWVNWCPKLGTVLANDEIINGLSVRGGYPVEQKKMMQWSMRIKAYAERLLSGLDNLDWTDAIKDQQRNWIGKSVGATVFFAIEEHSELKLEVFTTRPDTLFGVTFMVLAPEHPFLEQIVPVEFEEAVKAYQVKVSKRTERDRQADVQHISGVFTGAYAIHPFTKKKLPIWTGDYVLSSYGTGAVMSVPCGDQRDYAFAKHFNLPISNVFKGVNIDQEAFVEKTGVISNSEFLDGLEINKAIEVACQRLVAEKIGFRKVNFRLRDAIFSRQRYWGEPFPVYYENEIPKLVADEHLPIELPVVDAYLPTESGEPPLARSKKEDWNHFHGDRMEYNTMPGWAGSSWYFLRYLDPNNEEEFVGKDKVAYWQNVDLYIGGNEHATGHLLYARFWTKFLFDMGFIPFDEPFKKWINQGMILGRSSLIYRIKGENTFVTLSKKSAFETDPIHVDINLVSADKLHLSAFKNWLPEYADADFILEDDGSFICGYEVEKMSKSKFNVQTPDDLIEKFGADTLRMYEMFLGPVEQSKPWDTKGITGVHGFLKKLSRLFLAKDGTWGVVDDSPSKDMLKILHKTIRRVQDDLDRFSFNTVVSTLMIAVNELTDQKCNHKQILQPLLVLLSPYAPHLAEELWRAMGLPDGTCALQVFPIFDESILQESTYDYPISFNGKMRFKHTFDLSLNEKEIADFIVALPLTQKYLEGKTPKKVIVVQGKIVNIVS
jgi:leucyl-tRNA synthetase